MNIEELLTRLSKLGLVNLSNDMSGEWFCTFDENKVIGDPAFHAAAFAGSAFAALDEVWNEVSEYYHHWNGIRLTLGKHLIEE